MINLADAVKTEYTHSTMNTCENNICTMTLYSGTQFAKNNKGEWVDWEKAESLKDNGFEVVYLENDERYGMEVLDFNATSIKVKLNPKGLVIFPKDIDLKVLNKDKISEKDDKVHFNLVGQTAEKTLDFNMSDGEMLKFGDNSTTLLLQTANSQNLDDVVVESNQPTTNYDTAYLLCLNDTGSSIEFRSFIKFNISAVPDNIIPLTATLKLYLVNNNLDTGDGNNVSVYYVENQTWTEEALTWNTQPTYSNYASSLIFNNVTISPISEWYTFNVSSILSLETNNKFSMALVGQESPEIGPTDSITFDDKENLPTSTNPILNLTYQEIRPSGFYDFYYQESINGYVDDFAGNSLTPNNTLFLTSTWTDITTSSTIDAIDATAYGINVENQGNSGTSYFLFNVTITEGTPLSLNWTWRGSVDDPDINVRLYLWNFTGNSWSNCSGASFSPTSEITKSCYSENIANFVSDSKAYFLVFGFNTGSTDQNLYTDYVSLNTTINTVITNCTAYSGTGNYDIDCTTNCHVNTTTDLLKNNFTMTGNGKVYIDNDIFNFTNGYIGNYCKAICLGGCVRT